MDVGTPTPTPSEDLRIARLLAVFIALVVVGLGLYSVITEHYYGYSSRRNVEVILEGKRAISMGYVYVALGLMPLALCSRSGRAAGWWAALCIVAFVIALAVSLYG